MKKLLLITGLTTLTSFFTLCKAQYTILHNFNDTTGAGGFGTLTLSGNLLYGMAGGGGVNDSGCIFSIDTTGNGYADIYDFGRHGGFPLGSLTLSGTILYGVAQYGGANGDGCIFSFNTIGNVYTDLFDFNGVNGDNPQACTLVLSGTTLYGMTWQGGAGFGNIFSFNTSGNIYTDLFDFNGANGKYPYGSLLLSGTTLYGMTWGGGANNAGLLFSFNTIGNMYTDLHDFNIASGCSPEGSLILSGTTLYGMTEYGGVNSAGCIFSFDTIGNLYTDIYDFNFTSGGGGSYGSFMLSGTTLYGMTENGGVNSDGVVFSFDTSGNTYTDLLNFDSANGKSPESSLIHSGSTLYGMTSEGGTKGIGVIFKFKDTAIHNTGVKSIHIASAQINVYPNPSNGMFNVVCHSELSEESLPIINVYNILGEQVLTETLRSAQGGNTVDMNNQPSGVYLYRVIATSGELIGEGKLVIQK